MEILQTAEVRHSDPVILVSLIGVGRCHTSLGGKGKFGDAVSLHLRRVCSLVSELSLIS